MRYYIDRFAVIFFIVRVVQIHRFRLEITTSIGSHMYVCVCVCMCSYLIVHSFGRRMLYPGSVALLQKAMRPMLQQGQARLVEEVTHIQVQTHSNHFSGKRSYSVICFAENSIKQHFICRLQMCLYYPKNTFESYRVWL